MAKIKILPTSSSGEELIQQAITAIDSQLPAGKKSNGATPIRDAAGKIVSVEVNLPLDTASGDLTNAQSKVNENPGVSKAQGFPFTYAEDFESETNGQAITSIYGLGNTGNGMLATSSSPIAGTLSAQKPLLGSSTSYDIPTSAFGLSSVSGYEQSCKFNSGTGSFARVALDVNGNGFVMSGGNLQAYAAGAPAGTAVAVSANTTYELNMNYGATSTWSIDGTVVHSTGGANPSTTFISFGIDGFTDQKVDDLALSIYAGELA